LDGFPVTSDPRLEAAALDAMRELIAVLDPQGTIVLVNRAWREAALKNQAPAPIVAGTGLNYLDVCLRAAQQGDLSARRCHTGLLAALHGAQPEFELEYPCHSPTEERWFLLRALPLGSGEHGLLLLHSEVTERERLERALRGANRALRIRSECSRVLLQATEEAEALRRMCQVIVDVGGYRFAWVGFLAQDGAIRPQAQAGWSEGYLDFLAVALSAGKRGHGPAATAIRNGQPAVVRDIQTDPKFAPWRAEALARGYGSSVALPFSVGGVAGALSL
jgi:PAS domain-containing protein